MPRTQGRYAKHNRNQTVIEKEIYVEIPCVCDHIECDEKIANLKSDNKALKKELKKLEKKLDKIESIAE